MTGFLLQVSTPMESILKSLSDRHVNHPLAIVLGCREEVNQVFLVVEGTAIPVSLGIVSAIDRMLKLHFILNMEYAVECKHILHFLQHTVLDVADTLPLSRSACDVSMYIRNKIRKQ